MYSITWNTLDQAVATAEVTPGVDYGIRIPWLPRNVDDRPVRMNWAVVTETDGKRQIRMNWDLAPKDD